MTNDSPRVELAQVKLIKCVFNHNPSFRFSPRNLVAVNVILKNSGEFFDQDTRAHFLQNLQTSPQHSSPFHLEVEMAALFTLTEPALPLEQRHFLHQVFPRLAFPYLREFVSELTGRAGFPPLVINQSPFQENEDGRPEELEGQPIPPEFKWIH